MNCPTCGKIIASNAYNCPSCGRKFRSTPTNIFFKLALGFSIFIVVALVGLLNYFGHEIAALVDVYQMVKNEEKIVPNVVGKDFSESEKELALLGLKIKKRADRTSSETPNTVIEQLPKPGEAVKTGQTIFVVTSKGEGKNGDKFSTLKKIAEEDDSERIEEMINDKPKKAKSDEPK